MREIQRLDIYKESINKEIVPCIVIESDIYDSIVVPLLDYVNDVEDIYCSVETKTLGKKYAVMSKLVLIRTKRLTEEKFIERLPDVPVLAELAKCYDKLFVG